ncbi:MAG TPA: polyphosphate kinase 2 family protein [Kofleriaceae bacterium]|nr:polyphosphate kinase 2 family protein [Kofleriaceae bacterium]
MGRDKLDIARYTVAPGSDKVDLATWDPDDDGGLEKGKHADKLLARDIERLFGLQENLYAEGKRALLVVFQAMDTGGKDGTIKHVFSGVNPTGCRVTSFKAPSEEELAHDFLWRIQKAVPRYGEIGIFNRSHYEDVLIVRVRELVPRSVWRGRYQRINHFEKDLVDSGIQVLKFFLHISKEEQKERLEARLADPTKRWKFDVGDLAERKRWGDYQKAYAEALARCSTEWAPWIVVPANRKWYRNLVVARAIVEKLEAMKPKPRQPSEDLSSVKVV